MCEKYYECRVKISEDGLKEYLSNFLNEEEIERTDFDDEVVECVDHLLSNYISDYSVVGKNSIELNFE